MPKTIHDIIENNFKKNNEISIDFGVNIPNTYGQ